VAFRMPVGLTDILSRAPARQAEPQESGLELGPEGGASEFAKALDCVVEGASRRNQPDPAAPGDPIAAPPLPLQPWEPAVARTGSVPQSIGAGTSTASPERAPIETRPDASGGTIRQTQAAEVALAETPQPSSRAHAPRIDLPVFLEVLPKADRSVALAASREPAMAAALRGLPKLSDLPAFTAWGRPEALSQPSPSQALPLQVPQVKPPQSPQSPQLTLPRFLTRPMTSLTGADAVLTTSDVRHRTAVADPSIPGGAVVYATPANTPTPPSLDAPIPAGTLSAPLGTDPWQQDLSAQLALMAGQGEEGHAVMKLSPAELGDLEIRLTVRDGEATVAFTAAAPEARAALELAQPRLQEMFASQGMNLSETHIFNSLEQHSDTESWRRPAAKSGVPTTAEGEEEVGPVPRRVALGIVDTYA
jgi:hypothetical protein